MGIYGVNSVPHFPDPHRRGLIVSTTRRLRRLGKDIPAGTVGQVTGSGTFQGGAEIRIRTDLGCFVVSSGEIRQHVEEFTNGTE